MRLTLNEVARLTGSWSAPGEDVVSEWSIDTRTLPAGALYVALRGETHDGHTFLDAAAARGAAAALVDDRERPEPPGLRLIRVHDTLEALQRLAREARPGSTSRSSPSPAARARRRRRKRWRHWSARPAA